LVDIGACTRVGAAGFSFADAVTGDIFVADRSNTGVSIFSGSSLTFLGRATGFTGQQATTSVSGPDGVLTVTSGGVTILYGGDGNSTLRIYNATVECGERPARLHIRRVRGDRNKGFECHRWTRNGRARYCREGDPASQRD
jgi:hypothetical protein